MRTLAIDIETTPNLAYVWGLWNQNISPTSQLIEPTEMLCFVAKWVGEPGPASFYGGRLDPRALEACDGDADLAHDAMVSAAHDLLDRADVVLHFNGKRFDVPHLNREFLLAGLTPPSPYKQLDLLETCRKRFKFPSNKLAYVTKVLGFKGKIGTEFGLWTACMTGDLKAWGKMTRYNRRDVLELIKLYEVLKPWLHGAPTMTLEPEHDGEDRCPKCGSDDLERRGYAYTSVSRFRQYRCRACGGWCRSGKRDAGVDLRPVAE